MPTDGPNKVVQSSRQVIEHKLLTALGDPYTVAILASKEDLDLLIFGLTTVASGDSENSLEAAEMVDGLEQLRREAFGE